MKEWLCLSYLDFRMQQRTHADWFSRLQIRCFAILVWVFLLNRLALSSVNALFVQRFPLCCT
jgi:hypothetical protein